MNSLLHKLILMLLVAFVSPLSAQVQHNILGRYTAEHPLVYEDKWDMWPYAFLNDEGEPCGFNVDLVRLLMNELNTPYSIVLKNGKEVRTDVLAGQADISFGLADDLNQCFTNYSKSVIQQFTHSVISLKSKPATIHSLKDLSHEKVMVYDNSCTHRLMKDKGWDGNAIPYVDMKDALNDLIEHRNGQIIWNTASLEWLMRIYHDDNLQLTDFSMPVSKYRIVSADTALLEVLDSAFIALNADGKLDELSEKWFHPEKQKTGISSWMWYVAAAMLLACLILLFYYISFHLLERRLIYANQWHRQRLSRILVSSRIKMYAYDINRKRYISLKDDGQEGNHYTPTEFRNYFAKGEYEKVKEAYDRLIKGKEKRVTIEVKARDNASNQEYRDTQAVFSVLQWENGQPSVIIASTTDMTEVRRLQRQSKEMLLRYQAVFNTVMSDIVAFDKNGHVTDMNERSLQTFHTNMEDAVKNLCIDTAINSKEEWPDRTQPFHATLFLDPATGSWHEPHIDYKHTICYELRLEPVYDKNNQPLAYYGSGFNVTETANTFRKIKESNQLIKEGTELVTQYIHDIDYVMGAGGIYTVSYSPDSHILTIFKGMNKVLRTFTQSTIIGLLTDSSRKQATRTFFNMDTRLDKQIECQIETNFKRKGQHVFLHFDFIPNYDRQGKVTNYFGLCRDMTELENARYQLLEKTKNAQQIETQKNTFMRNMSFEIRTPLNSVVGFAELFKQPHSEDDEKVFVQQIKENANDLLHLIDSILFISRLDAHMVEIVKKPTDFAASFDSHCQLGWSEYQCDGVDYIIENPFELLVVDIDEINTGLIIEQIVTNAAQHTKAGHVKASYDYYDNRLYITISDNGQGMTEEMQAQVFKRFVSTDCKGSGLGLAICKELADQMGATINIHSEVNKGTIVWIGIPCMATVAKRKSE